MPPRRRYMKGNRGTEAPTALLFFDTESFSRRYGPNGLRTDFTLRLWTACYVRRDGPVFREPQWFRGKTAVEFWQLLERFSSFRRPLWTFAHNLRHDLTQVDFWTALDNGLWTPGPCPRPFNHKTQKQPPPWRGRMCLENRPTFLVLKGQFGFLKLVDTGNYWSLPLAEIGKAHGLRKKRIKFNTPDDEKLFRYCERDTDIIRLAMCNLLKWWVEHDCGTFQLTGAMCSQTNWRHTTAVRAKGGEATGLVLEDDSPARKPEREAAHGARVEAFYVGRWRGRLYHFDCNSLYPFVMRDNLFPRARVRSPGPARISELAGWVEAYGAVACVMLDTGRDNVTYPRRIKGVQVHASGCFTTWLCGPELVRACRSGHVREVFDCHLYSLAPLFRDWCDTWLERRRLARDARDKGQENFVQLILRSLAGKFAQRGDVWQDAPNEQARRQWGHTIEMVHETKEMTQIRWIAGHTQTRVAGTEPLNAFPSIFGYVCGYAREYMKRCFALMPERSLLYTATDSLICTRDGADALRAAGLIHKAEPGKFKLLGTATSAEICGPNWYRFGSEWTIGGFWGRAKRGKNGKYYAEVWDSLGSLLERNPHGVCGFTRTELTAQKATVKNDEESDGWRRPYRYSPQDGFCDPPPNRPTPIFREE